MSPLWWSIILLVYCLVYLSSNWEPKMSPECVPPHIYRYTHVQIYTHIQLLLIWDRLILENHSAGFVLSPSVDPELITEALSLTDTHKQTLCLYLWKWSLYDYLWLTYYACLMCFKGIFYPSIIYCLKMLYRMQVVNLLEQEPWQHCQGKTPFQWE